MHDAVAAVTTKIDYVAAADPQTLATRADEVQLGREEKLLLAIAAHVGKDAAPR